MVKEAVAVPELMSSSGKRWRGGVCKGSGRYLVDTGNTKVPRGSSVVRKKSAEGVYPEGPKVGGAVLWIGR